MKKNYFSVFSGVYYEIDEKYTRYLDCGQLPVSDAPKSSCKKCHGRGYRHINTSTGHYDMCRCVLRNASDELLGSMTEHQVEDVTMHTKKDSFKEIVDEVFD